VECGSCDHAEFSFFLFFFFWNLFFLRPAGAGIAVLGVLQSFLECVARVGHAAAATETRLEEEQRR
jgi:hypothetical protein